MGTYVSYKLVDGNGKILERHNQAACYSSITYGALPKTTAKIVCHQTKAQIRYTPEECERWIKEVNGFGFPCTYLGFGTKAHETTDNDHVFEIPILIDGVQIYKNKAWMTSALMMVRYLIEDCLEVIPREFFRMEALLPKDFDRFKLMLFCHTFANGNSNHSVRGFVLQTLMSKEDWAKIADKNNHSIYASPSPSITGLWQGQRTVAAGTDVEKFKKLAGGKLNVYVVGGHTNYANWLPDVKLVDKVKDASLVLFTGGEDVDPSMYKEPMGKWTGSNLDRDIAEKKIFLQAKKLGLKMLGICRGSQFLCAMSGGKLVQHQHNPGEHMMKLKNGKEIAISSTHHQAQHPYNLPFYDYEILGWTEGLCKHHYDGHNKEMNPPKECEIVHYKNTNALGIQGHPEFDDFQKRNPGSIKELRKIFEDFLQK